MKNILLILALVLIFSSCSEKNGKAVLSCDGLNTSHLMHLYDEIQLRDGTEAGIIHIYSEYPNYEYAIEPREGYTCVDDVARALVLLTGCERTEENSRVMNKLMDFILYMQSDHGYFYNFLWMDGSINKTYRTSVASPDWWSWRALWAMESYAERGKGESEKISPAAGKLVNKTLKDFLTENRPVQSIEGLSLPVWLPGETAADQAGVLILGLEKHYRRTGNASVLKLIRHLADGLIMMQPGDSSNFPYGAFLSWQNLWHAYGNSQSYALLKAGKLLNDQHYIQKALLETDHFYPWLIDKGFMNYFSIEKEKQTYKLLSQKQFPQIAYGFRPMIYACTEAHKITGERKYLEMAQRIGSWYAGNNLAGKQMYDPETGRCYDAINSPGEINKNSGAESTIEALLALQALEKAGVNLQEMFNNE